MCNITSIYFLYIFIAKRGISSDEMSREILKMSFMYGYVPCARFVVVWSIGQCLYVEQVKYVVNGWMVGGYVIDRIVKWNVNDGWFGEFNEPKCDELKELVNYVLNYRYAI